MKIVVLCSIFGLIQAIVTSPTATADISEAAESAKKEKRGVIGYGAFGHHHGPYPHSDEFLHHSLNHHHGHHIPHGPAYPAPFPPAPLPPPAHHPAPVTLGAHAHTTIVKKIGIPYHVPYPVKVPVAYPVYKPIPYPVPVPHHIPIPTNHWPHHKWNHHSHHH